MEPDTESANEIWNQWHGGTNSDPPPQNFYSHAMMLEMLSHLKNRSIVNQFNLLDVENYSDRLFSLRSKFPIFGPQAVSVLESGCLF